VTLAFPKPVRGSGLIARRERRLKRVATEQKAMKGAKARDGQQCRNPKCPFKALKLPVDPCHAFQHRGMGGDPSGTRTEQKLIVSACRGCHGLLDAKEIQVEPLDLERMADGPLAWYRKHAETGRLEHYATERRR